MNKVAQTYRDLLASLTERLHQGDRDVDALVSDAHDQLLSRGELTPEQVDEVTRAVRRDLGEFARSYQKTESPASDSVFMRVIRESIWKELADIYR